MLRVILGWSAVVLVGLGLLVNGCFMLISPKAWFRFPRWFAGRGSLTETRYGHGLGAVEVRVTGAIFIAVPLWVVYRSIFR